MLRILGVPGSLRRGSYNAALLRAAVELVPQGVQLDIGSIRDIPLYDGDVEAAQGLPASVVELKRRVAEADGLLLVTPEYNHSIPGVLKNAIDWMSRAGEGSPKVFAGRPVGLIGATPGGLGTVFSQTAWLPVLRALGTRPWFGGALYASAAGKAFDEHGKLQDAALREKLQAYLEGFADFVRSSRP